MSIQIDGNKVRFWSRKGDAIKAAKAIGWSARDVLAAAAGSITRGLASTTTFRRRSLPSGSESPRMRSPSTAPK